MDETRFYVPEYPVEVHLQYQTFSAPTDLLDIVEHFWAVENPVPLDGHREILIPNGRPTLLICIGEPGTRIEISGARVPNASNVAGMITTPIILEQSGVSSYIGAQLQPWGLARLGLPALVDESQPLATAIDRESEEGIVERCANEPFGARRTMPLIDLLRDLRKPLAQSALKEIQLLVEAIDKEAGLIEVERLSANMQIGYDRLYRRFKVMLGISPKQYASIMRFYNFTADLLQDDNESLARLASLQGYYDQAHASREFKRYTGVSQRQFRRALHGIAKLMQGRVEQQDSYNN